ncbi:hypothetical protein WEN_01310 [Mycoplasma wenyonii str. Massachusetts]|uniref:Lipoprotein n=1 Tax=Mycoplasma wenyonii (strain Massachusetts) TaxID=1197325 RepID=I6YAR9_MYCWM|nr:hypothetical protein [Mycoplasma wenyonii]AFN65061.1 hypothetical protein WEN_01310 [Mycoplasma wenyonii str. Massachusetts]
MKSSLLGKLLAFIGTGGSSCFLFGSPLDSEKNRDVLLTVEYKTENNKEATKGKKYYQGMPTSGVCVTNTSVVGNGYELMLKSGRVKSSNSKDYQITGAFRVYKNGSQGEVINGSDLDKFGLIALEFENSIHFLLVVETESSTGGHAGVSDRQPLNVKDKGKSWTGSLKENTEVVGQRVSVSREIVGFWVKRDESKQCSKQKIDSNNQLFQNYGNLIVNGSPWPFKVLDWVIWGEMNLDKYLGQSRFQKSTKKVLSGKSWFWAKQAPKNALIMKLSEATIDNEGIKDGKGSQIKWNSSIKPTIATTLER